MKLRNLLTVAAMIFAFAASQSTVIADQSVYIQTEFPDLYFRTYIREFDTSNDGYLSSDEIAAITEIDVNNHMIRSVKGIEYLTNLEILKCSDNAISTIDLSKNTNLKKLYCANNKLSTIDVTALKDLTLLRINGNDLTTLDLSKNTKLERVFTENNKITKLDFSNNPKLMETIINGHFYYWKEETEELGHYCISNIDGSVFPISYSPNTSLVGYESLYPTMNTPINSKTFPDQTFRNIVLTTFDTNGDDYLSVDEAKDVTVLNLGKMNLTSLKGIEHFPNLLELDCSSNELDELDLTMNVLIKELNCSHNGMDKLSLAWRGKILNCDCSNNYIRELNVNDLDTINTLDCTSNYLTSLDVSECFYLIKVKASYNGITNVITGPKNDRLSITYDADRSPIPAPYTPTKITKLFTDEEFQRYVNNNIDTDKDGILSKREMRKVELLTIPAAYCNIHSLEGIDVFENLEYLNCSGCLISDLDITKTRIKTLECVDCNMASLKVGDSAVSVICYTNFLEEAPFGKNTSILICYDNYINSISIKENDELYKALKGRLSNYYGYKYYNNNEYQLMVDSDVEIKAPNFNDKPMPTATPKPTAKPTAKPSSATATPVPVDKTTESGSNIVKFVTRLYTEVLGREAEEDGVNFWSDELYNFRRSGAEVGLQFVFSEEFINRNTTDDQFVTILYKTFFNREPEKEGFNFWTSALKDGTMDRMAVATGFIYSQEWADTCATSGIRSGCDSVGAQVQIAPTELTYAFVERMYTTAMKRASDSEGLEYWANALSNFRISGETVGAAFFLSDEMTNFNLNDKEYVTRLYKTFMDREPDDDGLNYWVSQLATGASRSDVVFGFTRSPEFTEKCVKARILPF